LQNDEVIMQVRNEYLGDVSTLSKETELTKKGLKMLGLIVKKKQMLQSELKYYFKGEIYAYVTELKKLGYITSEKYKNTRLLKPTKKFAESFQLPVQQ
ncbi:SMC-Scp complex subunit ScpB, partial [Candidatus Micrarchaeota archaeon]|nr:SMC-Scp complex subunit ScpB [Candidatus Micrarchaeota archaeon]